jgi:acetylglutamate kinase
MQKLYIIKIGGNIIDDDAKLQSLLKDLAMIKEHKILVHGGGKVATEISKGLGIEAKMVEGRRITDAETLKIVTMVYGGLINKRIVALLNSLNNTSIGLSGADANIIQAKKRPVKNGIDYGFVGDVEKVNSEAITHFISMGLTPVIAPLTHDGQGNMLNTNADTMASAIAVAMTEAFQVNLIYCFELKGVLEDFSNKESVIPEINTGKYQDLKTKGIIDKGMIPKMDNSFDAIRAGVESVRICHADDLINIINNKEKKGTKLS